MPDKNFMLVIFILIIVPVILLILGFIHMLRNFSNYKYNLCLYLILLIEYIYNIYNIPTNVIAKYRGSSSGFFAILEIVGTFLQISLIHVILFIILVWFPFSNSNGLKGTNNASKRAPNALKSNNRPKNNII